MAVTPFNYLGRNPIAMCIVDNTNLCASGWGKEVSINLSDQLIFKITTKGFDLYIDSDEDALLQTLALNPTYTHAVMIASGTGLKLNENIFKAIERLCEREFSIAGHILDRKEEYYELHHQFYVVNLTDYKLMGRPEVGKEQDEAHTKLAPIRSADNIHDDYVPLWIKQGTEFQQYQKKKHGWHILTTALEYGKPIIDIGEEIRGVKKYFYYEHDHVFIKEMPELYYHMFFGANFVPACNSDTMLQQINFEGPIEQYISVGTGYNWIRNLELIGYTQDTSVIFTDVNPNCLAFMKAMMEDWDGIDYGSFYKQFMLSKMPNGPIEITDSYCDNAQQQWLNFKLLFDDWNAVWSRIKQLTYRYIPVNYTALYNLHFVDPNKVTLFNVSDLFNYSPFTFTTSLKYRIACENRLISQVKEKNPLIKLLFTSRASEGFNKDAVKFYGSAGEFELTDINSLKAPPWHQHDWASPRMLG